MKEFTCADYASLGRVQIPRTVLKKDHPAVLFARPRVRPVGLGGSEEKERIACLHLYMPHHAHLVIARPNSVGHGIARFMTARHTDKAAVRQGDIAQLPSDIEVLAIDAPILLAVMVAHL